jgi:hypothetical protein
MDFRHWDELKLAELSGILPRVVSAHLSAKRPIRPQHLAAYLRVLDRQERVAFLDAWLRDNVGHEAIASLLNGTKTDSMPSFEENQYRMLDWWATAITRDSKVAKIFSRFGYESWVQVPSVLLLPVSTAAAQLQIWLLEKASSIWCLVRSVCSRVEEAAVGLAALLLALCQHAGQLTEPAGELAQRTFATSLVATSIVAPALAETTKFDANMRHVLSSPPAAPKPPKDKVVSRANIKRSPSRRQPQHQNAAALRIRRTIDHQWHRLVAARKSLHSAFGRLIRDAHPQQSKQKHRKQRRS